MRASPIGVYRTRIVNVVVLGGIAVGVLFATSDFTGGSGNGLMLTWRLPLALGIGGVLAARAWRRGVVVRSGDLEGRCLLWSWRVPWSGVRTCGSLDGNFGPPERGQLTVHLVDGRTRRAWLGRGRRYDPPFASIAPPPESDGDAGRRGFQNPNWPLLVALAAAACLLTTMAVVETNSMNRELAERGLVSSGADELRELAFENGIGRGVGWFLAALTAVAAGAALVTCFVQRGTVPCGPRPAWLPVPAASFDRARVWTIRGQHLRDGDGLLVASTTPRFARWVNFSTIWFWTGEPRLDFSVRIEDDRATIVDAAERPLARLAPSGDGATAKLYVGNDLVAEMRDQEPQHESTRCRGFDVVSARSGRIATIARVGRHWKVTILDDPTPALRPLLCAAVMLARHEFAMAQQD